MLVQEAKRGEDVPNCFVEKISRLEPRCRELKSVHQLIIHILASEVVSRTRWMCEIWKMSC